MFERKIRNVLVERLKYASNFIIFFPLYCRGSRIFLRKTLHLDPKKGENVTLTGLVESSSLLCFSLRDVRIPASFSRISSCIKKEIAFCIRKFVVNVFNKSKTIIMWCSLRDLRNVFCTNCMGRLKDVFNITFFAGPKIMSTQPYNV